MNVPSLPWDMVKIHPWKDIFLQGENFLHACSFPPLGHSKNTPLEGYFLQGKYFLYVCSFPPLVHSKNTPLEGYFSTR